MLTLCIKGNMGVPENHSVEIRQSSWESDTLPPAPLQNWKSLDALNLVPHYKPNRYSNFIFLKIFYQSQLEQN